MADDDELEVTPLHRSTLRPFTLFGAERELALLSVMVAAMVAFSALMAKSWMLLFVAIGLWFLLTGCLQALARLDPQMSAIYRDHVKLQREYLARSTPFRLD